MSTQYQETHLGEGNQLSYCDAQEQIVWTHKLHLCSQDSFHTDNQIQFKNVIHNARLKVNVIQFTFL